MYCVYKHTFPNNKVYIGITCRKPEHRWNHGKGYLEKQKNGKYAQPAIARAILKYGWDNVEHEILYDNLTKEEAEQKEIELIAEYQSNNHDFGYNITIGGGMPNHTEKPVYCEETKCVYTSFNEAEKKTGISAAQISRACRGKVKTAGKKHWRFISKEEIERRTSICVDCERSFIRNNLKSHAQKRCPDCQINHRRHLDRERKIKHRKKKMEHASTNKDTMITNIDTIKDSLNVINYKENVVLNCESHNKHVLICCIEADFYYVSIKDAAKSMGIQKEDVLAALLDNTKTAGGFHWKYEKRKEG